MIDSHVHIGKYGQSESNVNQLIKQMDKFGVTEAIASDMSINTYDINGNIINADKSQIELNNIALNQVKPYSVQILESYLGG